MKRTAPETPGRSRALPGVLTLFLLGSILLALPARSDASQCFYPYVPRPLETSQEIRERLEADGLWRPSRTVGRTPPINPQVGDTWLWYIWDLSGFPAATLKPCTVRGMGDNCYVVVDDDEWNVSIDQADVDRIVTHFEEQSLGQFPDQGIWDLNTSHFGDPPNPLDGLDRDLPALLPLRHRGGRLLLDLRPVPRRHRSPSPATRPTSSTWPPTAAQPGERLHARRGRPRVPAHDPLQPGHGRGLLGGRGARRAGDVALRPPRHDLGLQHATRTTA